MKVMVVDDVALNQSLLSEAIKDLVDGDVLRADRGTQAVEMALAHRPELIFMDIGLPDFDGLQVTTMLKNHPRTAKTTVIIVSAHALGSFKENARKAGCDGYLTKPVSIVEVRGLVTRLTDESQPRKRAH